MLERDLLALRQEDLALVVDEARRGDLADEELAHLVVVGLRDDLHLVALVEHEELFLGVLDRLRALVLLGALAREHAGADHDAGDARRHAQRGVAHVAGLLAEDRAEQLLFGRQLRLALRRDLADEDVAGLDLGADAHDARLVEILERFLADVRDVARDLFLAELGVAGDALELLDVDRGEDVVLDELLVDEDRVLEVVATPRHERDDHVLAERELAGLGRRTVGDHVAGLHAIARLDDRLLVHARVLVRALELHQRVDVGADRVRILRIDLATDGRRCGSRRPSRRCRRAWRRR